METESQETIYLTAREFIKALKGEDKRFIIPYKLHIDEENESPRPTVFFGNKSQKVIVVGDVDLNGVIFNNGLDVILTNHIEFEGRFAISKCVFHNIILFAKCIFNNWFTIRDSIFYEKIQLGGCKGRRLEISHSILLHSLTLFDNTFDWIILNKGYCNDLGISQDNICAEININSGYYNTLQLNIRSSIFLNIKKGVHEQDCFINNFKIQNYLPEKSEVTIQNCTVNKIDILNLKNHGKIYLIDTRVNFNFKLDDNVLKQYSFYEIEEHIHFEYNVPQINIINSDIGKTTFINCDFTPIIMNFKSSKITDLFLAGTKMPLPENINIEDKDYDQKRLALSQLKKVYENRGDLVTAMNYQAEELETYRHILKNSPKGKTKKERWNNRGEKASLYLNRHSTFYGNNWVRGIIATSVVTIATYIVFLILLDYTGKPTFTSTIRIWSYSLEFISPLPKSDDFKTILDNTQSETRLAAARIWGWISRIIVAYFVYQTIQAFRKFGKKA